VSPGSPRGPAPLQWRPLAYLLLGAGGVLLIAAVAGRDPVPIFLAIPLILAAPAAALSGPRGTPKLPARWRAEGTGPEITLVGAVRPAAGVDPNDLLVRAGPSPGLREIAPPDFGTVEGELGFRFSWSALEPTIAVVPPPQVLWRDAAGLVEREAATGLTELVIERYPPDLFRIGQVRLRRTILLPGETHSRQIGVAGEFYGIRDASPTDPLRRINWHASARAGRLLANEYQVDRTGDILLVLDTRTTTLGTAIDERLLSISRAAAVGIANSFLRVKSRVGLGVFGEFLAAIPIGSGRTQQHRIREALLRARTSAKDAPSERCAIALVRYFPTGVTTVVFSSLADENRADLVPYVRRRGFPVVALSPSPLPLYPASPPLAPADEMLVARLTRLQRRDQIARSWQEAPTVDWDDYWSLSRFVEYLRRPALRRIG
jgi:uncharacterized protein (DUF58 family)